MGFHFRAIAIAALIFGLALQPPPAAAAEWVTVTYEDAGFSAIFPTQPAYSEQTMTGLSAPYVVHNYVANAGDLIFMVGYTAYPADYLFDVDAELKANQDNFNNGSAEARLLTSRRTTYERAPGDALPALEFMSESDSWSLIKSIVILDGQNVYMAVAAANNKGIDAAADTDQMIRNFRLLPR